MMRFSPLFWPIQLKGNIIYILDETKLPQKMVYAKARNCSEEAQGVKEMNPRAAGQVILVMYTFILSRRQNINLIKVAKAINATRPTLPFKFLTEIVLCWDKSRAPLDKMIFGFLEKLKQARIKQARDMARLLKDGDVILTHCNVSGLMPLIAEFAKQEGKKVSFYVTETRPYLQGSRLSAWELMRAKIPVTIITDNMVAYLLSLKKVTKVIVGADHLTQNGDIANKIGTYQIAVVAKYFKVPFYVLCPPPSKLKSGKEIKIEIRPDNELKTYQGLLLAPKEVKAYYPAFDVTPANLITKHIYLGV